MGSTNKTQHLNLNQWLASDRPVRMDYVEDNRIIDEYVGQHINDNNIHLNSILKDKLEENFVSKTYGGTGHSQISVSFDFQVNYAIVFALDKPFVSVENSKVYINSGIVNKSGGTKGLSINGDEVVIRQDTSTTLDEITNLNKVSVTYMVMAFK